MTKIKFCLLFMLLSLPFIQSKAISLLPVNLTELVASAEIILNGICIGNRTELDTATNLPVTYTTFKVQSTLKGTIAGTHTIKQPAISGGGIPSFEENREYIIFLPPASELGFSSPVGLDQGSFRIFIKDNQKMISNGRELSPLFDANSTGNEAPNSATTTIRRSKIDHATPDIGKQMTYDKFITQIKQREQQ